MKAKVAAVGCLGWLFLIPVFYVLSVLWWSFWLCLGAHFGGLDWSYIWTATHWGLLCPVVLG